MIMPAKYYNRFDITKNYQKLLFLSGQGLQAAELNEIQETLLTQLQRYASRLVKNGTIMSGGDITSITLTTISIAAAEVSINGAVLYAPAATIDITGTGLEFIGITTVEHLIVDTDDPTIREPDPESPNYLQPGSYRYQLTATWSNGTNLGGTDSFFPIISLSEGQVLSTSTTTTDSSAMVDLISAYDKDTRGSYLFEGLKTTFLSLDPTTKAVNVSIGSGKARVLGKEVLLSYSTDIQLAPLTDLGTTIGEPYTYSGNNYTTLSGTTTTNIKATGIGLAYSVGDRVRNITPGSLPRFNTISYITAIVDADNVTISPAITGMTTSDTVRVTKVSYALRYKPVESVQRILGLKQVGSYDTAPEQVTHGGFSGASDLLANTPVVSIQSVNQGGTWNVETQAFIGGTTFTSGVDFFQNGDSIDWSLGGAEPAPGSTYKVVYRYNTTFVPTVSTDLLSVLVSLENEMVINQSFSVDYKYYLKRTDRINLLSNGILVVTRGSPGYTYYPAPVNNSDMLSLATVSMSYGSVPTIEEDTVVNMKMTDLKKLVTDVYDIKYNLAQLSLLEDARQNDPTTNKRNLIVDPLYDYDLIDAGATPANSVLINDKYLTMTSLYSSSFTYPNEVNTLPYTNVLTAYKQERATDALRINPYSTINAPIMGDLELSPGVINMSRWVNVTYSYVSVFRGRRFQYRYLASINSDPRDAITPSVVNVAFSASGFQNGETVRVTFRSSSQDIVANGSGSITGNLTLVAGTLAGNYLVDVLGLTSGNRAQKLLPVVVTVNDNVVNRYINYVYDPLAQTFWVDDEMDLSSIGLNFAEKLSDKLVVKIVKTSLGLPNKADIVGQGSISVAAVNAIPSAYAYEPNVNNNLSALPANPLTAVNGSWAQVNLDYPVKLTPGVEYAMVLVTTRNAGAVRVASMSYPVKKDQNNTNVTTQTADGVLLLSANESTWTPSQTQDLAYRLYRANYSLNSSTVLWTANVTSITDWLLSANVVVPDGCTATFNLTLGANTYEVLPDNPIFTLAYTGTATLTMVLTSASSYKSPFVSDVFFQWGTSVSPAYYTQRAFSIPNGSVTPAKIRLLLKQYMPSGTTITASIETSTNTFTNMTQTSATPVGDGWYEAVYELAGVQVNTSRLRLQLAHAASVNRPAAQNIRILVLPNA